MDPLQQELDQLEDEREFTYVMERSRVKKDATAYEAAGISKSLWYSWPQKRREYLTGLALQLKRQRGLAALMELDAHAVQAARAVVELLDSDKESIRLRAAQDILDRTTAAEGEEGVGAVTFKVVYDGDDGV